MKNPAYGVFHVKHSVSLLALLALAACGEKQAEGAAREAEPRSAASAPVAGPKPAGATQAAPPRGAKAEALYGGLAGVWAAAEGCGDPLREWRIEPRAFHADDMHCDVLLFDGAESGARAVADCLVDGASDGAEDSFLFLPQSGGGLVIVDETIGVESEALVKCRDLKS